MENSPSIHVRIRFRDDKNNRRSVASVPGAADQEDRTRIGGEYLAPQDCTRSEQSCWVGIDAVGLREEAWLLPPRPLPCHEDMYPKSKVGDGMCTNAGPKILGLYQEEPIDGSGHHPGQPKIMFNSEECDDSKE